MISKHCGTQTTCSLRVYSNGVTYSHRCPTCLLQPVLDISAQFSSKMKTNFIFNGYRFHNSFCRYVFFSIIGRNISFSLSAELFEIKKIMLTLKNLGNTHITLCFLPSVCVVWHWRIFAETFICTKKKTCFQRLSPTRFNILDTSRKLKWNLQLQLTQFLITGPLQALLFRLEVKIQIYFRTL